MKVLLVEDNRGDARLIQEMLGEIEAEQFDLLHVESLAAALKCLNETTVDVVLLDLSLPDSHGLDTFIKIHTQSPAIPIVVMSGFGDETFAVEAVRQGAQDYLTKGKTDSNLLMHALRYAVERQRIENALKQSEEKLHITFESITDAIVITDTLGSIVQTNEATTRMTGYSREEIIGKSGLDLIDKKYHDMAVQTMIKVFEEGHDMESMELQFLTRDGGCFDAEFSTAMIRDASGNPIGFVSIARDITERKRMEQELKEREEKLHFMFQSMGDMIVVMDLKGDIVDVNEATVRTLGYKNKDELIGRSSADLVIEGYRDEATRMAVEAIKKELCNDRLEYQYLRLRTASGGELEVEYGISLIRDASGNISGVLGIGRDITERKRQEQALRASEEKLRTMFESTSDGILVTDPRFNILQANQAAARIFGHKNKESLIGTSALGLISVKKAVDTNGKQILIEFSFNQIRDAADNLTGNIGVARDVTVRRQMEHQIKKRMQELQAFYGLAEITEREGITPDKLYQELANILPKSWQYPEVACARIVIGDSEFRTENFAESPWKQSAPVKVNGSVVGRIEASYVEERPEADEGPFQKEERLLIDAIAERVGHITERKQTEDAIQQRNRELSAINTISQSLSQQMKLNDVLQTALSSTLEVTGLPAGGIWLIDKEKQGLVLTVHKGVCERFIVAANKVPLGADITGESTKTGSVTVSRDICDDIRVPNTLKSIANLDDLRALISVPLRSKGKTLGVMNIFDREPIAFPERDIRLLETIGGQIGTAIENAQLLENLEEISITDKLTGLYNRRHFYEVLELEVNRTLRYKQSFSLAMIDLDGFKLYNDMFGHVGGDDVLKDFARTLKSTLRKNDAIFRYGGDEFAIVFPSTDAKAVEKIIERIRAVWPSASKDLAAAMQSPLGFSAGVAQLPEDINTLDGLIFMADAALYKAKRAGKYRTELASEMESALNR